MSSMISSSVKTKSKRLGSFCPLAWLRDMLAKEVILHGFNKLLTTSISGFYIIRPINMVTEITDNDIISPMSTG